MRCARERKVSATAGSSRRTGFSVSAGAGSAGAGRLGKFGKLGRRSCACASPVAPASTASIAAARGIHRRVFIGIGSSYPQGLFTDNVRPMEENPSLLR